MVLDAKLFVDNGSTVELCVHGGDNRLGNSTERNSDLFRYRLVVVARLMCAWVSVGIGTRGRCCYLAEHNQYRRHCY